MIDIKGLNKAEVLKALYDGSHIQGMGFMQAVPDGFVTVEHCQQLLEETAYPYFDYLYGRVMKIDLSSDESFEERLYDRDNGPGAAQRVIDRLRNKESNAPRVGTCHLNLERLKIQFGSNHDFPRSIDIRFGDIESINAMIHALERTRTVMEGGWIR